MFSQGYQSWEIICATILVHRTIITTRHTHQVEVMSDVPMATISQRRAEP